jgi:hyaluronate lyase
MPYEVVRNPVHTNLPVVAGRFLVVLAALLFAAFTRADEYDDLRLKWRDTIVGTGYDTADPNVASRLTSIANAANSNWSSMDKSPTRTFLWPDLASTTISIHINYSYQRLHSMALAYATPGCSLHGNATLLADTISGLDWMHANRYNATKSIYDNWYEFEIGSPIRLVDIAVLLYDQLSPTQISNYMGAVEKFTPSATTQAPGGTSGSFTGSNRMLKIRIVAVRGGVVKDAVKLAAARDAFSNLFAYVTTGDGFYTDGSFIQHLNHPYTAAYGSGLLASMAPVMNWLSGSTWAVTDPLQSNVFSWVFDSYEPIIYNGAALDLVRGREAGRAGDPQGVGHTLMDSVLQIAQFAPPAESLRMKRMVKEWALSDTVRNFVSGRPLSTLTAANNLMADISIVRRGELIDHYTFPEMDRVVRLGKGFGFGLSMCSTRIANFESINGNNLRGWFTGDGMTTLYNGDLNQFGDDTNCTIDAYRLPGVTADVTHSKLPNVSASIGPRAQGESTLSPHPWVGGAKLGNFGAAGMQFKGVGVTLTGKKSWFMFDDEIVCLGAGITSTDSRPIETTVENRKINGSNALTVNGTAKSTALGWNEAMAATSWAHLQGNVSGSDIGYYFPTAPTIRGVRESRSASPSEIDVSARTTIETRSFLRLGFEHGNNPTGTTYQYVLLPGRNAKRTGNYAAAPHITVLNNNANVQAVRENTLGITAANFWTDNNYTYGGITSNKKACVLVRDDGPFIDVSVSDPTQLNTTGIDLQIALNGGTLVSADSGVTVTQSSPSIMMTINTANSAGKTFKARFYKLTPEMVNLTPVADSYVYDKADSVDSNFGTQDKIIVKKAGAGFNRETFLRFDVPPGSGVLLGATMKLYSLVATTPGIHAVAKVDDNTWTETGITWNNRPAAGSPISTWTPVLNTTSSTDVTSAIPPSGVVSFKVHATTETSNGIVNYASRENATAANRPQLSLAYGHTPPEVTLTSPSDGDEINNSGAITITADAVPTDGAVTSVSFYHGATLLGTDATPPYSITTTLANGSHTLTAVATDSNSLSRTSLAHTIEAVQPPFIPAAITWDAGGSGNHWSMANNWSDDADPTGDMLTFNSTGTAASGVTNTVDTSISIASLTYNQESATLQHTTAIDAGQTLAATGNFLLAGSATATTATNVSLTGATGTLTVGGASFQVGQTTPTSGTNTATLDMSGLGTFNANLGNSGIFRMGSSVGTGTFGATTTVKLAATSNITADVLGIGDRASRGGGHVLKLGSVSNQINANTISIGPNAGGGRGNGEISFETVTGTLILRAADGEAAVTAMNLVNTSFGTSNNLTASANFAAHSIDAKIDTLVMARRSSTGTVANATATLIFDTGTLEVGTLNLAENSQSLSTSGAILATMNIGGGNASFGAITMATSMGGAATTTTAALNFTGGTTTVNGNIARGGGNGTTATLALNGPSAVLDMTGKNITNLTGITYTAGLFQNLGIVNTGMTLAGTGSRVFNQAAGISGEIQGTITGTDVGLAKQGPGTLTLTGTNTYSGNTTIEQGILRVMTPNFADASTVAIGILANPGAATLDLPNPGNDTVATLIIHGVVQAVGKTYGNATSVFPVIATSAITGPGTITVPPGPGTPYTDWAASFLPGNDVSNPADDNDNDGLTNQQEFAFGLNPVDGASVSPILVQLDKSHGTFTYQRRAGTGLSYRILTSTSLAANSWTEDAAATQSQIATSGGDNETVVVTLTGAPLSAPKFFIRVAAE